MGFDDLQRQWRTEVNQPLSSLQRERLQHHVRQRCVTLERGVCRRDVLEIAAVPVLLIWVGIAWPKVITTWLSMTGTVLLCVWAISVAAILLRMRHQPQVMCDAPSEEFIRQKLRWCDSQLRLLKSVAWWYVLPPLVAALLLLWGKAEPHKLPRLAFIWLSMVAFGFFVVRLNQRAADKHFASLRDDLNQLLKGF